MSPPPVADFEAATLAPAVIAAETVCHCLGVSHDEIATAVETCGLSTVREVGRCTGAGLGCMSCHRRIKNILTQAREAQA